MAYTKNIWGSNDLVTAEKLNHMEEGIESAGSEKYKILISTQDWDEDEDSYTYEYTALGMTSTKQIGYVFNSGIDYLQTQMTVTSDTDKLIFSTEIIPTDTIEITIFVV